MTTVRRNAIMSAVTDDDTEATTHSTNVVSSSTSSNIQKEPKTAQDVKQQLQNDG